MPESSPAGMKPLIRKSGRIVKKRKGSVKKVNCWTTIKVHKHNKLFFSESLGLMCQMPFFLVLLFFIVHKWQEWLKDITKSPVVIS